MRKPLAQPRCILTWVAEICRDQRCAPGFPRRSLGESCENDEYCWEEDVFCSPDGICGGERAQCDPLNDTGESLGCVSSEYPSDDRLDDRILKLSPRHTGYCKGTRQCTSTQLSWQGEPCLSYYNCRGTNVDCGNGICGGGGTSCNPTFNPGDTGVSYDCASGTSVGTMLVARADENEA